MDFWNDPVVDLWAKELAKAFLNKFPNLVFRRNDNKSLLTIDTGSAICIFGKGISSDP